MIKYLTTTTRRIIIFRNVLIMIFSFFTSSHAECFIVNQETGNDFCCLLSRNKFQVCVWSPHGVIVCEWKLEMTKDTMWLAISCVCVCELSRSAPAWENRRSALTTSWMSRRGDSSAYLAAGAPTLRMNNKSWLSRGQRLRYDTHTGPRKRKKQQQAGRAD